MNGKLDAIKYVTLTLLMPGLAYGGSFIFADGDVFNASTPADIVAHAIGYEPKAASPPSSFSIKVCSLSNTFILNDSNPYFRINSFCL